MGPPVLSGLPTGSGVGVLPGMDAGDDTMASPFWPDRAPAVWPACPATRWLCATMGLSAASVDGSVPGSFCAPGCGAGGAARPLDASSGGMRVVVCADACWRSPAPRPLSACSLADPCATWPVDGASGNTADSGLPFEAGLDSATRSGADQSLAAGAFVGAALTTAVAWSGGRDADPRLPAKRLGVAGPDAAMTGARPGAGTESGSAISGGSRLPCPPRSMDPAAAVADSPGTAGARPCVSGRCGSAKSRVVTAGEEGRSRVGPVSRPSRALPGSTGARPAGRGAGGSGAPPITPDTARAGSAGPDTCRGSMPPIMPGNGDGPANFGGGIAPRGGASAVAWRVTSGIAWGCEGAVRCPLTRLRSPGASACAVAAPRASVNPGRVRSGGVTAAEAGATGASKAERESVIGMLGSRGLPGPGHTRRQSLPILYPPGR